MNYLDEKTIKSIIRLHKKGYSGRAIATSLNINKDTALSYIKVLKKYDFKWSGVKKHYNELKLQKPNLKNDNYEALKQYYQFHIRPAHLQSYDFKEEYGNYSNAVESAYSFSAFRKHITQWLQVTRKSFHVPGYTMFVRVVNNIMQFETTTRKKKKVKVSVVECKLRYSGISHVELVFNTDLKTVLDIINRAMARFNGRPRQIILKNYKISTHQSLIDSRDSILMDWYSSYGDVKLKQGKSNRKGNEAFKAKILTIYKDVYGHVHINIDKMHQQLVSVNELLTHNINKEITDKELVKYDTSNLKRLPDKRFTACNYATAEVQPNGFIHFGESYYSVAYIYIGKKVLLAYTEHDLCILYETYNKYGIFTNRLLSHYILTVPAPLWNYSERHFESYWGVKPRWLIAFEDKIGKRSYWASKILEEKLKEIRLVEIAYPFCQNLYRWCKKCPAKYVDKICEEAYEKRYLTIKELMKLEEKYNKE